jgi:hypothetical protein
VEGLEGPFLREPDEAEQFGGQWRPRRVLPADGVRWPFVAPSKTQPHPNDLEDAVVRVVGRMTAESTTKSAVVGFAVEVRDGMSWSATRAREIVQAKLVRDGWTLRCVWHHGGRDDRAFQQLVDLLGGKRPKRTIRKAAGESRLVPQLHRPWAFWFVGLLVMMLAGTAAAALDRATSSGGAPVALWAAIGVAPVLGLLSRTFAPQITPLAPSQEDAMVEAALREEQGANAAEDKFIALLLAQLAPPKRSRTVIVEDFGELSPRAQTLVKSYLKQLSKPASKELWLLFSRGRRAGKAVSPGADGQPLNAPVLASLPLATGLDSWYCRQDPLKRPEKQLLLQVRDKRTPPQGDPRLRQRSIGNVVKLPGTGADAGVEVEGALKGLKPVAVRAFALLATAAVAPDPALFSASELADIARDRHDDEELRRLFRAWFPDDGSRAPAAIKAAFNTVADEASALLEDPPEDEADSTLRVIQVYADAFLSADTWAAYELPEQDLAHAFWALYWHGRLQKTWSATVADRLVAHLRAIKEPARMRRLLANRAMERLLEAFEGALGATHALCIGGIVPEFVPGEGSKPALLDQGRLLLAVERGAPDQRRTERLLTAGWFAYMLTGEWTLLDTISGLNGDVEGEPAEVDDPLLGLYREMVPRYTGQPPLPLSRESRMRAAVVDHARARAAWLAGVLGPHVQGEGPPPRIAAAGEAAPAALREIVDRAVARLRKDNDDDAAALDQLTLAHVLLCDALATSRGETDEALGECLQEVPSITAASIARRKRSGRRTHFVLDGLLRQLDATARGCAALAGLSERPGALAPLWGVLTELEGLHVMWHNMELGELADLAILARSTLGLLAGPEARGADHDDGLPDYLVGIGTTRAARVHRMEAELLVGAARLQRNASSGLGPLTRAANAAIDNGLGADLALGLCIVVLRLPNAPDRKLIHEVTAYAIEPHGGHPGVLDVPERRFVEAVLQVVESLESTTSPVAIRAVEVIQAKAEDLRSPWVKDRVSQCLESYRVRVEDPPRGEELEELLERWRDRVYGDTSGANLGQLSPPASYVRDTWYGYPFLLSFLWPASGQADDLVLRDAVRLLAKPTEHDRGHIALAMKVARQLERALAAPSPTHSGSPLAAPRRPQTGAQATAAATATGRIPVLVDYDGLQAGQPRDLSDAEAFQLVLGILREGLDREARMLWPINNWSTYLLLSRHDTEHAAEHLAKAEIWRVEDTKLQADLLVEEHAGGRGFEIFWHHYTRVVELPMDCHRGQLEEALGGSAADIWDLRVEIPEPIVWGSDGLPAGVSCQFIRAGFSLLHADPKTESDEHNAARRTIDEKALEHVMDLYRILIERTTIPEPLREVFREQRARFFEQRP